MPQHKDTFDPIQTIHDFADYYGVPVDLALKVLGDGQSRGRVKEPARQPEDV